MVTWLKDKSFILELGQELLEPGLEIREPVLSRDPADQVGLLEAGRQEIVSGWLPAERTSLVGPVLAGHVVDDHGFQLLILGV